MEMVCTKIKSLKKDVEQRTMNSRAFQNTLIAVRSTIGTTNWVILQRAHTYWAAVHCIHVK